MNLFDKSLEYDEMLNKGISISGEDKHYFIRGRIKDLSENLPLNFKIERILDFGCGLGDSSKEFLFFFPGAMVTGTDTSTEAIQYAQRFNHLDTKAKYFELGNFNSIEKFDLCYVNGVFHHIPIQDRSNALKIIYDALIPGGILALFENNPLNPGTKLIMNRIPFDHDANTLYHWETKMLLIKNGFKLINSTRFLFYFPNFLKVLRPVEKYLSTFPFGAQYYVLAVKNK